MFSDFNEINKNTAHAAGIYTPEFFRLSNDKDKDKLQNLFKLKKILFVHNELPGQLAELVKSQNPRLKLNETELAEGAQKHLGGCAADEYGVWVYYPWSGRLVHLLDEEEFVEVRTNRNKNKITEAERKILSEKKIGVIGLSVGQSVSLTMAMERSFGELRIADFDKLELSNLNRIRTPVYNLGEPKVIAVAREIAELDPFLKVKIYPEGITESNVDDFLTKDGHLDILIDECDGLDIKVLCRQKAKKYGIPVVMEASDRGTVDVERFDLEPDRPVLHGLVDHLDFSNFKKLKTNEERVPYLLPFVGVSTMSARLKASMLEVGQTISTWPQLASAVVLGGGVTADVCRRIALDEFRSSGRYFVDVEQLIGNPVDLNIGDQGQVIEYNTELYESIIDKYVFNSQRYGTGETIPKDVLGIIVGGNNSSLFPYNEINHKWLYKSGYLLLAIPKKYLPAADNDLKIYLGACVQTMILKARQQKIHVQEVSVEEENGVLTAVFKLSKSPANLHPEPVTSYTLDPLITYIANDYSTEEYNSENVRVVFESEEILNFIKKCPDGKLTILNRPQSVQEIARVVGETERVILLNEENSTYLKNKLDAVHDLPASARLVYSLFNDSKVRQLLRKWDAGSVLSLVNSASAGSGEAFCLLSFSTASFRGLYDAGRWLAEFSLIIAGHGLTFKSLPVPFYLPSGASTEASAEQAKKFKEIFGITDIPSHMLLLKLYVYDKNYLSDELKNRLLYRK